MIFRCSMNKKSECLLLLILLTFLTIAARQALPSDSSYLNLPNCPRQSFTINDNWKFKYFQTNMEDVNFINANDSSWSYVNIPHTWNREDAFDDNCEYRRGYGWYSKTFFLANHPKDMKIFLHFEGANQVTHVFINGNHVGKHIGGYTAFTFDITSYLKFDGKDNANHIMIKVDNLFNENVPPLSADFTFYGGIYRDIWLIATNPLHITLNDRGSNGIFVNTEEVNQNKARVKIRGSIVNDSHESKEVTIINTIVDWDGSNAIELKKRMTIASGTESSFEQLSQNIKNLQLWSPETPYLYKVYTKIYDNGELVDQVENPLGFRWFSFDAKNGFSLNGKPYTLYGTNRHQDFEGMGNALPNWVHENDLKIIKENGFNLLRLAHYPQDPVVLKSADKLGLIIWEEIPIVNYVTRSEEFKYNCQEMLKEMIHQHYNHPSIIMWGYMNEVFLHDVDGNREKKYPADYVTWTINLAKSLEQIVRDEDPYRTSVMALHQSDIYNASQIGMIPEVVGYNLYPGWYSNDFLDFGEFIDKEHNKYPARPIVVSEYGAGSDERLHSLKPKRFDFTVEYQQLYHESYFQQIIARPYLNGTALWNQFDFGSATRGDSKPTINQKGIYTFDRKPKDIAYYYKAQLCKAPVIRIASHECLIRTEDNGTRKQSLKIYSNLREIELYLNGKSLGVKSVDTSKILEWEIEFEFGNNTLEARGKYNDIEYSDRVEILFKALPATLRNASSSFDELAVNVGATNQYIDEGGCVWESDRPYANDGWGFIGGDARNYGKSEAILNTDEDPVYQTFREGLQAYCFDVPGGDYEIELRFVEYSIKNSGERVFDVQFNNKILFENLDLVKQFGYLHAGSRIFIVHIDQKQGLEIRFDSKLGKTVLSGIRIKKY
jgi:beta-galactosidase